MKIRTRLCLFLSVWCVLIQAPFSLALWSSDPAANLGVAVKPGEQTQPKVVLSPTAGFYVSWFDNDPDGNPPEGDDVFLQLISSDGNLLWDAAGVCIADRGRDWAQDYGLAVDGDGNALLSFLDDRFGQIDQVTAVKVDPDGNFLWGPTGVQLTDDLLNKFSPKITVAEDGSVFVAWGHENDLRLQRLDSAGTPLWAGGVTLPAPAGDLYLIADLHSAGDGTVIVSWVHSSSSGQHLHVNKLSRDGDLLWGSSVLVYDAGSMQRSYRPPFVADGSGGAVLGWYSVFPTYEVHAQHILADGSEAFPHNGSLGTTDPTHMHVQGRASFNPVTSETFLFWSEEWGELQGVCGQKFSPSGARLWGDTGRTVLPGTDEVIWCVRNLQIESGAAVFWIAEKSNGLAQIIASRLDGNGDFLCEPLPVSTFPSPKSRLETCATNGGMAVLVWKDDRSDYGDIYAQNFNLDCSLGPNPPGEVSPPGAVQPLLFTGKETLFWEEGFLSGSTTFNLYRGLLSELATDRCGDCLLSGLTDRTADDTGLPGEGDCFFYVVAGENDTGEGPLGSSSDGSPRQAATPCP